MIVETELGSDKLHKTNTRNNFESLKQQNVRKERLLEKSFIILCMSMNELIIFVFFSSMTSAENISFQFHSDHAI